MAKRFFCLIYFLVVAVAVVISSDKEISNEDLDYSTDEWDVLLFTQVWPVTSCFHWMEKDKNHACNLPKQKEFWTIHGIWPTKYGTVGPGFCNKTAEFDIKQLEPIENRLKIYWPNIFRGETVDSLWNHEWLKHGTCASSVSELNGEKNYFGQGLAWREKYLISNILDAAGIFPDSEHTVINLQDALKKSLNKNPSIHCNYDRKTDTSFLVEIRICFNKTLDLIDCDGVAGSQIAIDYPGGKVITNCHISKPVQYPSIVPPIPKRPWKFPFVNLYKLLNFVMWFTL